MTAGANERLRSARKAKGISQEALARSVGVSQATINRYETGVIPISPLAVRPLCEKLGCSEDWLSSGTERQSSEHPDCVREGEVSGGIVDEAGAARIIDRLRGAVSAAVGIRVTDEQALEWVIRKAGLTDEVFPG
ncbi:helix-turn-helix transcriptional regulator [Agrobacterium rubi]|nr:helix-turn-helix transcriptional regulator [Agrobacterium rubi]NTF24163.1 helix-turn-helix transcriptional regulator [Agrobacterium rubi]